MRYRLRSPRQQHELADLVEQEEWKKKLASVVEQVQQEHAIADVEVWTEDEHRLGLKPVLRDIWVPQGEQPIANVCFGVSNGCGCMALFTLSRVRRIGGFCLKSISNCSTGF